MQQELSKDVGEKIISKLKELNSKIDKIIDRGVGDGEECSDPSISRD